MVTALQRSVAIVNVNVNVNSRFVWRIIAKPLTLLTAGDVTAGVGVISRILRLSNGFIIIIITLLNGFCFSFCHFIYFNLMSCVRLRH